MVAEVFSLNNLFVGLLFSLAACFHHADSAPQRRKFAQWGALCCGLGLCNQHTLVLYVAVIVPWVLLRLHSQQELSLRVLAVLGLCFLGGFLPYAYLPVSSSLNWALELGGPDLPPGLLTHLLRAEYGTFSLAKTERTVSLAAMLQAQLDHCVADLSLPVLILAGVACFLSISDRRRCVLPWLLVSMLLLYSLFFAWRANLDINKPLLLGVVERFWLQSDAALCVLAGLGLSGLQGALEQWLGRGALWSAGGWALTAMLVAHLAHSNHRDCDLSRRAAARREPRRPGDDDVPLVCAEAGAAPQRGALPRPPVGPSAIGGEEHVQSRAVPGPQLTEARLRLHRAARGRPQLAEELLPLALGRLRSAGAGPDPLPPGGVGPAHRDLYNWTEPHDSFHPGSWERVANEEMWQARMKTAFFLYDLAERVEGEAKAQLFDVSYTLYKEIVEKHKDHPSNWDKNMALASERLLRAGGRGHSQDSLLSQSIKYFKLYLDREPTDPQAEAIRGAISHLLKERRRLRERHAP
ncbi:hypothetical protein ANANG_G00020320 [Anguilla anguilla]|uniref:Transmembrane protein 260 n=1 Tax=Anguilla anguilla TaxID=7936 RepID=A0A9D3S6K4_ANGAN|nr:hypothetical protein ANANG_G00020320 [Anguilla anguilla]